MKESINSTPFEIVTYVLVAIVLVSAVYTYFTSVDPRRQQVALIGIGLIVAASIYVIFQKFIA